MKAAAKALLGWDLVAALVVAAAVGIAATPTINNSLAKDLYGVGTSVLSIVFSMFLAALAIIMSSGTDDFIRFLKDEDVFDSLMTGFKMTLGILFVALIAAVAGYGLTAARLDAGAQVQSKLWLTGVVFLFGWALFATASTSRVAVRYAEFRARFLRLNK